MLKKQFIEIYKSACKVTNSDINIKVCNQLIKVLNLRNDYSNDCPLKRSDNGCENLCKYNNEHKLKEWTLCCEDQCPAIEKWFPHDKT